MRNHELEVKDEPLSLPSRHHFGHKFLKLWGENHESDQAITEFGTASFNKGILDDDPRRENEDAIYCDPKSAVFALFDSDDSTNNAMKASEIAATVARESVEDAAPENADDLADMVESINDAIYYDQTSGHSTGTIGRVIIKNGKKFLLYASIGDSRIYLIRDGDARQITIDENEDHHNPNTLGKNMVSIRQIGETPLKKDDWLVFCSKGVTDNFNEDFKSSKEFASTVIHHSSASHAASALIKKSTVKDDRTAIVVKV